MLSPVYDVLSPVTHVLSPVYDVLSPVTHVLNPCQPCYH